jgi:phage-related protein
MNRLQFVRDDIQDFLMSFDGATVNKISKSLELLDELGLHLGPPHTKKIQKDLYELRILSVHSMRIFYTFRSDTLYILHAFVKKTQKTPRQEISTALGRLRYLH